MNPDQSNQSSTSPVTFNTVAGSPPTTPPTETVVVASQTPAPRFSKKALVAGLTILALIAGIATSVYLVSKQARYITSAWDCTKYSFNVSITGEVTIQNQADRDEPAQNVSIEITPNGGTKSTKIFNVPALKKGENANLGSVSVPNGGGFSWNAIGSSDCKNNGVYPVISTPTPQACVPETIEVKPVSGNWNTPDKFTMRNTTNSPITFTYILDCWEKGEKAGLCKDKTVSVTLQPGESKADGYGNICSKWQLDLRSIPNCPNKGYIAEETCTTIPTPRPSSTPRPSATTTPRPSSTPTPGPTATTAPTPTNPPTGGGPTNTPNPTNPPTNGEPNSCNGTCGSDANCKSGLTCYTGYCRNPNNPSNTSCDNKPTASNPTSTPVTSLPTSGAAEYTWALAIGGVLLLGLGGLLAL